jgi:transposase
MRTNREEWAKRVGRWKDSGLTAKEFAGELGINPRSLTFWKWQLGKPSGPPAKSSEASVKNGRGSPMRTLPLIELGRSTVPVRFELELSGGRRLAIPATFDPDALRRLLAVLDPAS